MLLVSYDFSNNKVRTKFSKFLEQYGSRIQYSVFLIKNSKRILTNIMVEIEMNFKKKFGKTDSVYIFSICEGCQKKIVRYGSAKHEESDIVFF